MPNFLDQDGTVQLVSEIKDLVDGELHTYLRPNLLDNWYFVGGGSQQGGQQFPINRRGQTSYSGAVYGIDRWRCTHDDNSLIVNSGYIRFYGGAGLYANFEQVLNIDASELAGKTVTITALLNSSATMVLGLVWSNGFLQNERSGKLLSTTITVPSGAYGEVRAFFQDFTGGGTFDIIAVKLELGSTQTLVHNEGTDEEPVWVLNEIPDYEYQLMKCNTSKADANDTYANKDISYGWQLLWTNPSPSSQFAGQTISLDLSMYSEVVVKGLVDTNGSTPFCTDSGSIPIDKQGKLVHIWLPSSSTTIIIYTRTYEVSSTGVIIENCISKSTTSTSGYTTNNIACIPLYIYARQLN